MKNIKAVVLLFLSLSVMIGCSKDAEDAANSDGFPPATINGIWKETKTGLTVRISGVSATSMGTGIVISAGTAMPSTAVGGACLTEVEYLRGGYWEAYNNTFYPPGTWRQTSVAGMAMSSDTQFKIGSAVYVRQ